MKGKKKLDINDVINYGSIGASFIPSIFEWVKGKIMHNQTVDNKLDTITNDLETMKHDKVVLARYLFDMIDIVDHFTDNDDYKTKLDNIKQHMLDYIIESQKGKGKKMVRKLGKLAARKDDRTLRLARYTADLPDPPKSVAWQNAVSKWGMLANDQLGDCTCATVGHTIQVWSGNAEGSVLPITDDEIVSLYSAVTGYSPDDPNSDNGAVEMDVLNYWRQNPVHGVTIHAYVGLNEKDHRDIKQAVYLFGSAYIGVALPYSAQDQEIWDAVDGEDGEPGSWGGHAINVVGYDDDYLYVVTWGAVKKMTWAFWDKYCDESYALLSDEWITDATQKAPSGFDLEQLEKDLKEVTE